MLLLPLLSVVLCFLLRFDVLHQYDALVQALWRLGMGCLTLLCNVLPLGPLPDIFAPIHPNLRSLHWSLMKLAPWLLFWIWRRIWVFLAVQVSWKLLKGVGQFLRGLCLHLKNLWQHSPLVLVFRRQRCFCLAWLFLFLQLASHPDTFALIYLHFKLVDWGLLKLATLILQLIWRHMWVFSAMRYGWKVFRCVQQFMWGMHLWRRWFPRMRTWGFSVLFGLGVVLVNLACSATDLAHEIAWRYTWWRGTQMTLNWLGNPQRFWDFVRWLCTGLGFLILMNHVLTFAVGEGWALVITLAGLLGLLCLAWKAVRAPTRPRRRRL